MSELTTPSSDSKTVESAFRYVLVVYVGFLFAAVTAIGAVVADVTTTESLVTTTAAFAVGAVVGVALSRKGTSLANWLGEKRRRWLVSILSVAPFVVVAVAAIPGFVTEYVGLLALLTTIGLFLAGYVLSWLSHTQYTASRVADRPILTCRWEPPKPSLLDRVVLAGWLVLATANAAVGDWLSAVVWLGIGLGWLASGLTEGRFRLGETRDTPEIRVYENGLVKQRPYVRSFVPWSDVDHVRLREGELVLDRGLFDVRLERDALETPEQLLTAIERQHSGDGPRSTPA
ncbi:hypothetical protein [Natronobacterium gregoryi]|nr:hypothetical protein [Natronobacterium gregoryi]AFZ72628.1 hypothetical protein Natgr_1417 [Natronobacterium gregoryi SP2]SFI90183.1 hypothetical protein SAMN05443661_1099 [Natronobacterium gregoryi]